MESIGSLESERMSLEIQLDRVKTTKSNPAAVATTTVQLEAIKARYERVKVELDGMKDERRRKEQAYKVLQKETKSCEMLQGEIIKLKETKVQLIRQQREAASQNARLKDQHKSLVIQSKKVLYAM